MTTILRRSRLPLVVAAMVAASSTLTFAADPLPPLVGSTVGTSQVTYADPSGAVVVIHPRSDLGSKGAYNPDQDIQLIRSALNANGQSVALFGSSCQIARTLSASKSMAAWAPGKPHSTVYSWFSTQFNAGINGLTGAITDYCVDGHSLVRWYGADPINADLIGLTDSWHADGLAISLSYPGGGGFSTNGTTISFFPGNASNTWKEDHYYSGIHFTGLTLWGCNESAAGQVKLGTNWFYPVAYKNC